MRARNERPEDETPAEKDGGFGGGPYPLGHKNELAKLEGRALKWNIKQEWREAILKRQVSMAIDPGTSPRDSARAAKFVLDADKFEEERQSPQKGTTIAIQNNVNSVESANVAANRAELLRHVLNSNPDYLDYVRSRTLAEDIEPSTVREDSERESLEDGEASRGA